MQTIPAPPPANSYSWKSYEKLTLRIFFVYFFLQAVPLDWKFYRDLFSIDWAHLHYGAIFHLAHYAPSWSSGASSWSSGSPSSSSGPLSWSSGPPTYTDWAILLGIAIIAGLVWTAIEARRTYTSASNNDALYYWIRVIVRYRLAIAILAYGFIKLFPLQAPFPSLSNLNTNYGDFTRWKLFSLSLGIVPSYESFLGLVEITSGLLLFYRRSAPVSALIIAIFLGNVFMSNLAYGGGDEVYSLYLITLALFILSYDIPRLTDLLIFQRAACPGGFRPVFHAAWQRWGRLGLKAAIIVFFVGIYGFKTRSGYHHDPYQFPTKEGLAGASGVYNVSVFRINKDTLAYSKTDTVRWQDVVFEKWSTLSIRSNRAVDLDLNNVERPELRDQARTYELEGSAARHYYSYTADTVNGVLTLQNKNPNYKDEKLVLHYDRPAASRIVLWGTDQHKDSLYVVLDRIDKHYLLEEARKKGRTGGLKL